MQRRRFRSIIVSRGCHFWFKKYNSGKKKKKKSTRPLRYLYDIRGKNFVAFCSDESKILILYSGCIIHAFSLWLKSSLHHPCVWSLCNLHHSLLQMKFNIDFCIQNNYKKPRREAAVIWLSQLRFKPSLFL